MCKEKEDISGARNCYNVAFITKFDQFIYVCMNFRKAFFSEQVLPKSHIFIAHFSGLSSV